VSSVLYRLGRWCFRHRWHVVAIWVAVAVVLAILALGLKKPLDNTFTVPGTNSQDALNLLDKEFPGTGGAQAQVVFSVPASKTLSGGSQRQGVEATLAGLRRAPQVVFVSDPYTTGTVSKNGRIAYATVAYPVAAAKLSASAKSALLHSGGPAQAVGVSVNYGGEVAQASTQSNSEIVGIVVAFVVLLLGFGSILAALLPLMAAILGVAVTELILMTLTSVATESSTTSILAVMLGLAVGIDYSLFIMNRHRQGMVAGQEPDEAAARAVATSGGAVCFAGATVLIALLALSVVNIPFLTTMGWAAAIGVAVAVLISVTLVPALLGFSGRRLISTRWARRQLDAAAAPGFRPLSRRYVSAITTRMPAAVGVVVAGVAILIVAGYPGLHLRLGLPDAGSQPTSQTTRQAYDLISKGFGPGANGPLVVVSYAPHGITESQTAAAARFYAQAFASFPDIAEIIPPEVNPAKNLVLIEVIPKTGPNDPRTSNLITLIRHATAGSQQRFGLQTYVTGQTALNVDVSAKLSSALPLYLGVVVVLCLLILLMVFRSFLVPLTAVIGYVLSILATLGVLTFVFQEGHLANLFGVSRTGPILSFLPVLMIGILFGLAMDYEVFLVSRMREEFVNHGDPQAAIVEGFSDSAKVVASAGIIMISVFAAFIFSDDPTTKSLGFALALGVLLDAFVVRMTLVPASMRLFGRAVWWLPRPLERRLPDLDIEGSKLETAPTPSPSASLSHR
jgi:RND superfamily putative drug exporter